MKIMCVKTERIPETITKKTISVKENIFNLVNSCDVFWLDRPLAERDQTYKQIIPYVLLKNSDNQFACYQRHGTETRLHDKYSAGIGGHIEECDNQDDIKKTILAGMNRELSEELANFQNEKITLKYLGIINEVESEVGLVHLGVVYIAKCQKGYVPEAASELKNMEWKSVDKIKKLNKELWTELAFNLIG